MMPSLIDQFWDKLPLIPATMEPQTSQQSWIIWTRSKRIFLLVAFLLLGCVFVLWHLPDKAHNVSAEAPTWLVATMTPYHSLSRRAIIRSSWQQLYQNQTSAEFRFVLSRPDPLWEGVLAHENNTYGDLIILRHLDESTTVSNHIKTVEFFSRLIKGHKRWSFVSKIDDDSYLDARTFYTEWLEPLISNRTVGYLKSGVPSVNGTAIGRVTRTSGKDFTYPGGQFYTLSWDLVEIMAEMYELYNVTNEPEDVLVGELLDRSGKNYTLIELPNVQAFHISWDNTIKLDGIQTAWANEKSDLTADWHPVGPKSINPHRLKEDKEYLLAAACYGPFGPQKPRRPVAIESTDDLAYGANLV